MKKSVSQKYLTLHVISRSMHTKYHFKSVNVLYAKNIDVFLKNASTWLVMKEYLGNLIYNRPSFWCSDRASASGQVDPRIDPARFRPETLNMAVISFPSYRWGL